jgi:hypothetical protein
MEILGTVDAHKGSMEPWNVFTPLVADWHYFDESRFRIRIRIEVESLGADPHQRRKSDPDPYQREPS